MPEAKPRMKEGSHSNGNLSTKHRKFELNPDDLYTMKNDLNTSLSTENKNVQCLYICLLTSVSENQSNMPYKIKFIIKKTTYYFSTKLSFD